MQLKILVILTILIFTNAQAEVNSNSLTNSKDNQRLLEAHPCNLGNLEPGASSPPNNTDDPDTTDTGCFEINNIVSFDFAKNSDGSISDYNDNMLDMNYGVRDGLEAAMVIHYNTQDINNNKASALGRIEFSVKQSIYENQDSDLDITLNPEIDFMASKSTAIKRGLPDSGTNLTLPILISKKYGPIVVVNNAGFIVSLNDSNEPAQVLLSTSAGVKLSKSTILTGEIYRTSDTNLHKDVTTTVGVGLSAKLSDNALMYMSLGKTIGETADGSSHIYALAGVRFFFGKGSHNAKEFR
jgi:hypothetical protein